MAKVTRMSRNYIAEPEEKELFRVLDCTGPGGRREAGILKGQRERPIWLELDDQGREGNPTLP